MTDTILVVAAHPDDEVLGCGATMAAHVRAGDVVHVLILAEGITSRSEKRSRRAHSGALSKLAQCARKANRILGVRSVTLKNYPDNRLDSVELLEIVRAVERHVTKLKPQSVYTHHANDLNVDHRRVHEAVVTACRPVPGQTVKRLMFFEVPSSTEWQISAAAAVFAPNRFVDISATLELKVRALQAYSSEMRDFPHPRSLRAVEHLACWRGASAGLQAAEAFMIGREIVA